MPEFNDERERWDVIDAKVIGYRIDERVVASDEDVATMRMRLPPGRSMIELAMPMTLEETMARAAIERCDPMSATRFIDRWSDRTGAALTEDERRLWLFLLFELAMADEARARDQDTRYDGMMLPGPSGAARIRRLVAFFAP